MIESAAMLASSLYSCLTPTVLFLLLNLVIATIAVSSFIAKPAGPNPTLLARSPFLVFDRLRSLSFRAQYHHSETLPEPETHSIIHKSEPEPESESEEAQHHHIDRSRSDTMPVAGEMPEKLPKKMKKSATLKSAFNHFEAEEEEEMKNPKRPATTREREREKVEEEVEVDARADDFINRFRHQLKLQRLDSILRYKEMIKRGAAN